MNVEHRTMNTRPLRAMNVRPFRATPLRALFGGLLALVLCVGPSASASASHLVILSEANRAKLGERSRRTTATPNPASTPSPSPAPSASQSPNRTLIVKGRLLVVTPQYLTFTTGDSVRLEQGLKVPAHISMGTTVRVNIDPQSRVVTAVRREDNSPEPAEIDAAAIPRDVVAVDSRSARTEAEVGSSNVEAGAAGAVGVTIHVTVPNFTPSDSVITSRPTARTSRRPSCA